MGHLVLALFTSIMQCAVGIVVFAGLASYTSDTNVHQGLLLLGAIMATVGVSISLLHLGRPIMAMRTMMRVGTSWLSREILFTSAFAGLSWLALILSYVWGPDYEWVKPLTYGAGLVGLVDVGAMAAIYMSSSVKAWPPSFVAIQFFATALAVGAMTSLAWGDGLALSHSYRLFVILVGNLAALATVLSLLQHYRQMTDSQQAVDRMSMEKIQALSPVVKASIAIMLVGFVAGALHMYGIVSVLWMLGHILVRFLMYSEEVAPKIGVTTH